MTEFKELGIIEPILKSIEKKGFTEPTYIQEKSIPEIIKGNDVVGMSATGSGKTLAFGCGIIQNLEKGNGIGAVILTPTRELAEQVCDALKEFSKFKQLSIIPVYGGVSISPQIEKLKRADIVVGTPGRMLDHLERGTIDLSRLKTLVLDEADRMVDMGFIIDVEKIIKQCPKDRQTLMFSATISSDIKKIEAKFMNNPIQVKAKSHVDPTKLKQEYYDISNGMKFSLLVHFLKNDYTGLSLVFCNTRRQVDFISTNLKYNKIDAVPIHGGLTQARRSETLKKFTNNKVSVLVCTDVAARGLDIPGVSHVYNYDLPNDNKEYVHRIGRTARAGKDGKVVNILSQRDHDNFSNILNAHRDLNIERYEIPKIEKSMVKQSTIERSRRGDDRGRSSGRGSRGPRGARGPRSDNPRGRDSRGPRSDNPSIGDSSRGPRTNNSNSRGDSSNSNSRGPRRDSRGGQGPRGPRISNY